MGRLSGGRATGIEKGRNQCQRGGGLEGLDSAKGFNSELELGALDLAPRRNLKRHVLGCMILKSTAMMLITVCKIDTVGMCLSWASSGLALEKPPQYELYVSK